MVSTPPPYTSTNGHSIRRFRRLPAKPQPKLSALFKLRLAFGKLSTFAPIFQEVIDNEDDAPFMVAALQPLVSVLADTEADLGECEAVVVHTHSECVLPRLVAEAGRTRTLLLRLVAGMGGLGDGRRANRALTDQVRRLVWRLLLVIEGKCWT